MPDSPPAHTAPHPRALENPPLNQKAPGDADRFRTLLEINNAVISNLTQESLFQAIAQALRRVIPIARTAIFLHDPQKDVLRLSMLEATLPSAYFSVGLEMPPAGSHVGWVFQHRQPLHRRDLEEERQFPMEDRAYGDGVRSYVIVPLVVRERCIGTLAVASTKPNQYSETDASFLQEAANQIALAVENMRAYEALEQEVALRRQAEEVLRSIMEGTAGVTGVDFFHSMVRHLASALRVRYAFLTECLDENKRRVRTLAFWSGKASGKISSMTWLGPHARA
jgi:transcriptional regulator with GAF, ATPase, and Fis domain